MRSLILALLLVGCGDDDGGGSDGGGGGEPPVISMVVWTHEAGCTPSSSGDVTVVTTVTDADTPAAMLTFSGNVSGCMPGTVDSASATVTCPNVSTYPSMVRVQDPEGNFDTQAFSVGICEDGSAP
jgi:hypothetical protein